MPRRNHGRSFHLRELSCAPLYWEWLEDILSRYQELLVANHLFNALYASLFVYDKCPTIVRAIYEYDARNKLFAYLEKRSINFSPGHPWLPRASVVRLPLWWSCSSIQRTQNQPGKELHSSIYSIPYSSTALWSQTDHRQVDRTLVVWTSQISRSHEIRPLKPSPSPNQNILTTKVHGWTESHVIFDELGVPKCERTETFLMAFLSCWLCLFIIPLRYAGCIRPGTFL